MASTRTIQAAVLLTFTWYVLFSFFSWHIPGDSLQASFRIVDEEARITNIARYQDVYYLASSNGIVVAEMDPAGKLTFLSKVDEFPLSGHYFAVHHGYLVVQQHDHLKVFDLSDPIHPVLVATHTIEAGYIRNEGEYLYNARFAGGIDIYYLGNLPHINRAGRYLGEQPPIYYDYSFDVSQGLCAGVFVNYSLQFVDCRNPVCPALMAESVAPPGTRWEGAVYFDYPYCFTSLWDYVNDETELICLRITQENSLETVFSHPLQGEVWDYSLIDERLLLACDSSSDQAYLISMPQGSVPKVQSLWDIPFPSSFHSLGRTRWLNPYLFVFSTRGWDATFIKSQDDDFQLVDIFTDLSYILHQRVFASSSLIGSTDLIVNGRDTKSVLYLKEGDSYSRCWEIENVYFQGILGEVLYACVYDEAGYNPHLRLYDVSNPYSPVIISDREDLPLHSLFIQDGFGVGLSEELGVQLLDMSDPAQPEETCRWKPDEAFQFTYGVVDRDKLYVCDVQPDEVNLNRKLWIVDISDLQAAQVLAEYPAFFSTAWCLPYGNILYVADRLSVWRVDVSDPTQPNIVSTLIPPNSETMNHPRPQKCLRLGHYLITDWQGGWLWVYDLDEPNSDLPIGQLQMGDTCYDSMVLGGNIYAAAGAELLEIIPEFFINGDVNEDGVIDATDTLIMSCFFSENLDLDPDPVLMDVNRDQAVSLPDLIELKRIIVTGS